MRNPQFAWILYYGYEPEIDQIFLFHLPIPQKGPSCKLHISD